MPGPVVVASTPAPPTPVPPLPPPGPVEAALELDADVVMTGSLWTAIVAQWW
jgi:hypothetical protein